MIKIGFKNIVIKIEMYQTTGLDAAFSPFQSKLIHMSLNTWINTGEQFKLSIFSDVSEVLMKKKNSIKYRSVQLWPSLPEKV